jgi:hypothetical protein
MPVLALKLFLKRHIFSPKSRNEGVDLAHPRSQVIKLQGINYFYLSVSY